MNAVVEIQTQRPISLELYKDYKELGRFMLRYVGSTIAAGVVTEVTPAQSRVNMHSHRYRLFKPLCNSHLIKLAFSLTWRPAKCVCGPMTVYESRCNGKIHQ